MHIRSSSSRVRSVLEVFFFYIENFLHEIDFETILPIMLVEYHCGCSNNLLHGLQAASAKNIIHFFSNV